MSRHRYFELDEFVASGTARRKGIDNTPTFEVVEHLSLLVETVLDPLRAAYGMPIKVTSGYRCEALNRAVGGVRGSAHLMGYAADLQVGGSFQRFREFATEWFRKSGVRFDQLLLESDKDGNEWLHVGLYNSLGQQRGQIKTMKV